MIDSIFAVRRDRCGRSIAIVSLEKSLDLALADVGNDIDANAVPPSEINLLA